MRDYFFHEEVADQQTVSFGRPLTREESGRGTVVAVERVGRSLLTIKLDDRTGGPTARWRYSGEGMRMVIRIPKKDYEEARCLPGAH